ncbi:PIN domain-containing protein [Lysobacter sp.]|uniref:PIN domain-containing protein n=1 Tax=Lysobacter sp. TaxID=72226 RepID=UPI002D3A707A|nr:PIN domain-containing protein [Lysobacter sp.]HZX76798.1 PIN domain-containing protein [Lysobacter sp.]
MTPRHPPRIVLDTNVCLDLLAFGDPVLDPLRAALQSGAVVAIGDAPCRAEWQRVLTYPVLRLDEIARVARLADYDDLMTMVEDAPAPACALPRCADPDDQKFLQLAAASGAQWLLTRDDALLRLARRTRRDGLFDILTPVEWSRAWSPRVT